MVFFVQLMMPLKANHMNSKFVRLLFIPVAHTVT